MPVQASSHELRETGVLARPAAHFKAQARHAAHRLRMTHEAGKKRKVVHNWRSLWFAAVCAPLGLNWTHFLLVVVDSSGKTLQCPLGTEALCVRIARYLLCRAGQSFL